MDAETVREKMTEQVDRARNSGMARLGGFGWVFEIDGAVVYVTMRHRRRQQLEYLLRADFSDFPRRAPSYVFVDRQTREENPSAWPPGVKHSAELPGVCTPGTREFHEHWHRNDAQYDWDPDKYTFQSTLHEIHRLLERGLGG